MASTEIYLGGIRFKVISLNGPISADIEVYPGDPKVSKKTFCTYKETGYNHYIWNFSDHVFHPHADAPNHQNDDERGIDSFGINFFFNSACMVDLSVCRQATEVDGISYCKKIDLDDLMPFKGRIDGKGALVVRTGYDRWIEKNKKHDPKCIPYFTKEAADFIASFKLNVIAVDSLTVDPPGQHYVHKRFKEMLIVESLVNLHEIPKKSQASFDLQTSALPIKGASGGPVCAYAFIRI